MGPGGSLDSQTSDSQYIHELIGTPDSLRTGPQFTAEQYENLLRRFNHVNGHWYDGSGWPVDVRQAFDRDRPCFREGSPGMLLTQEEVNKLTRGKERLLPYNIDRNSSEVCEADSATDVVEEAAEPGEFGSDLQDTLFIFGM